MDIHPRSPAVAEDGGWRRKSGAEGYEWSRCRGCRLWTKRVPSWSTVVVNLEGRSRKVSFGKTRKEKSSGVGKSPAKAGGMISKRTQTDYRESEAQTLPWKHELKVSGNNLQQLQSLTWLNSEKDFPVGMSEVRLIESTLERLGWEEMVRKLTGAEDERKTRWLMLRATTAEAEWRERRREEEDRERIELSRREMGEKKEAFEEKLQLRLLKLYGCRRTENDSNIVHWQHQLRRNLRKIKSRRSRSRGKANIIAMHEDKGSDLYAPKLRDGENPSLGHEVIRIQCRYLKRFHGLETLEKKLFTVSSSNFSGPHLSFPTSGTKKAELCLRRFRGKVTERPKEWELDGVSAKVAVPALTAEPSSGRSTPVTREPLSETEESLERACLLLKSLIRGRAVQSDKFLGLLKRTRT